MSEHLYRGRTIGQWAAAAERDAKELIEMRSKARTLVVKLNAARARAETLQRQLTETLEREGEVSCWLEGMRAQRNALAAHVGRLREGLHQALIHWGPHCTEEDGIAYAECEKRCDAAPETSYAQLKAQWQAEAMDALADKLQWGVVVDHIRDAAEEYRRQAERGER